MREGGRPRTCSANDIIDCPVLLSAAGWKYSRPSVIISPPGCRTRGAMRRLSCVQLNLSGNKLGAEGAKVLAPAIAVSGSVTRVDVRYNDIAGDGASQLLGLFARAAAGVGVGTPCVRRSTWAPGNTLTDSTSGSGLRRPGGRLPWPFRAIFT